MTAPSQVGVLLPCPFCGGGDVHVATDWPDTALCRTCRASHLIEHWNSRATPAAVAELIEATSFFVNDDRQRAWHSMYREPMGRLRAALAAVEGTP